MFSAGAGEMTQQVRALVDLAEDLVSVPSTHIVADQLPVWGDPVFPPGLHRHQVPMWNTDTYSGKHSHNKNKNKV